MAVSQSTSPVKRRGAAAPVSPSPVAHRKAGRLSVATSEELTHADAEAELWKNTDGEHGTSYYCSGRPKPYFRGKLHLYSAMASPIWTAFQCSLCQNGEELCSVVLACFGATTMLGTSGLFHRVRWKCEASEARAALCDYSGIYLQIAFSGAPLYLLLMARPLGWLVIGALAACAAAGIATLFSGVQLGRHFGTCIYILMGLIQLVPICTSFVSERPVASQLLSGEKQLLYALAAAYLVGAYCYAHATPKLWPRVFGFHELWHLLVVVGSACSYAVNCSLLQRLPRL